MVVANGTGMPFRVRVWLGGVIALVVLGLLAVVSLRSGAGSPAETRPPVIPGIVATSTPSDPVTAARLAAIRRIPGDPLALGPVTAPVVVAQWGDFQCPFCRAFALDTEPALISEYVDSGRMRLEWHDLAYLGPESVLAARAARAAGRQGAFWPFHDALYRDQDAENSGALTDASLTATALSLGLDLTRFARDLADPAITADVARDQRVGAALGITRVPTFLINGDLMFGAQPVMTFRTAIDAALAARR